MQRKLQRGLMSLVVAWAGISITAEVAVADVLARVRLRGGVITDTTVGGLGTPTAQHADTGSLTDAFHTRTNTGALESDATQGLLEGFVEAGIEIPGTHSRLTPFAEMYVAQVDTYTIGAGTTGLSNGDPVQVRIEAVLSGRIVIGGRPSGSSEILFNVTGVPGVGGPWVDWSLSSLDPPQDISFDEDWSIIADTTVGATIQLSSNLEATFNGTAWDGPITGSNTANGSALVRVSPGPGHRGLAIISEAGAPTTPIVPVPMLSLPMAMVLLAAATVTGALLYQRSTAR